MTSMKTATAATAIAVGLATGCSAQTQIALEPSYPTVPSTFHCIGASEALPTRGNHRSVWRRVAGSSITVSDPDVRDLGGTWSEEVDVTVSLKGFPPSTVLAVYSNGEQQSYAKGNARVLTLDTNKSYCILAAGRLTSSLAVSTWTQNLSFSKDRGSISVKVGNHPPKELPRFGTLCTVPWYTVEIDEKGKLGKQYVAPSTNPKLVLC